MNTGCGFACTVHANSARDALTALVNAAIMAGENVSEPAVRSVFASATDYVVHLDLDEGEAEDAPAGLRRQVMEVLAVVPSLHDDFSTEPILRRERLGRPLEWTGVLPPNGEVLERRLPTGCSLQDVLAGRGRSSSRD